MDNIIIPQSLLDQQYQEMVQNVQQQNEIKRQAEQLKMQRDQQQRRQKFVNDLVSRKAAYSKIELQNQQIENFDTSDVESFQAIYDRLQGENANQIKNQFQITIPDNFDTVEFEANVNRALENIGSDKYVTMYDLEMNEISKGRYKISVPKKDLPIIMHNIMTMVRKMSEGQISARVLDIRQIDSLNYGSKKSFGNFKLSPISVSFKLIDSPRSERIVLSYTETSEKTGNLLFYMQSGEKRTSGYINKELFSADNDYMLFLANVIHDYFEIGFEKTRDRIVMEITDLNGLERVESILRKNDKLIVEAYRNPETDKIESINVSSDHYQNNWLQVFIRQSNMKGIYQITLTSKTNPAMYQDGYRDTVISINWLIDNVDRCMKELFIRDFTKTKAELDNEVTSILNKFVFVKMRKAVQGIIQYYQESNYLGLHFERAMSRAESKEVIKSDISCETLIFKTNHIDYAILICYLDPRIKKYCFKIEYSVDGKEAELVCDTFEEILSKTKILTETPSC